MLGVRTLALATVLVAAVCAVVRAEDDDWTVELKCPEHVPKRGEMHNLYVKTNHSGPDAEGKEVKLHCETVQSTTGDPEDCAMSHPPKTDLEGHLDSLGQSSFSWGTGEIVGQYTLKVTLSSLETPVSATCTINLDAQKVNPKIVAGDNQETKPGKMLATPLDVQLFEVLEPKRKAEDGTQIEWLIVSGDAEMDCHEMGGVGNGEECSTSVQGGQGHATMKVKQGHLLTTIAVSGDTTTKAGSVKFNLYPLDCTKYSEDCHKCLQYDDCGMCDDNCLFGGPKGPEGSKCEDDYIYLVEDCPGPGALIAALTLTPMALGGLAYGGWKYQQKRKMQPTYDPIKEDLEKDADESSEDEKEAYKPLDDDE